MSLDNNTTGLNEILNMAKNLPNAGEGGEAVQEIVYVSADWNIVEGTVTLTDYTVEELFSLASETPRKYIILHLAGYFYLPVLSFDEGRTIGFGISFTDSGDVVSITVTIKADGTSEVYATNEAVPTNTHKVAYVDCDIDMSTFTISNLSATYDEIVAMVEAGRYVVLRGKYVYTSEPINTLYVPLAGYTKEAGSLFFEGMVETRFNDSKVVLHCVMYIHSSNVVGVNVSIVSVTDLN